MNPKERKRERAREREKRRGENVHGRPALEEFTHLDALLSSSSLSFLYEGFRDLQAVIFQPVPTHLLFPSSSSYFFSSSSSTSCSFTQSLGKADSLAPG